MLALVPCLSWANPVGFKQAVDTAERLLGKAVGTNEQCAIKAQAKVTHRTKEKGRAFYIFNAADGQGFVIVSGEEEMPALVAYSPTGHFDDERMPPALTDMLEQYVGMVEAVRSGQAHVAAKTSVTSGHAVVGPLCQAEWGQDFPYNAYCPQQEGENCPVGCVATAMAEIMHHFQWPKQGIGSYRYVCDLEGVGTISSNFGEHTYEWSQMGKTWEENVASVEVARRVAQLSYDCGIATRMAYALNGSGTNDDLAMVALYTYFGYKASTLDIKRRDCYATQREWNEQVKMELNSNRPVLYGGFDKKGGGHEFIIDGYDDQGNFHVNWGWDGICNGYYSIITLAPDDTDWAFSIGQSMVCGIEPDFLQQDKTPMQWRIYMAEEPSVNVEQIVLGKNFSFTFGNFYNYRRSAQTWTHGVALYTLEGEQMQLLTSRNNASYTNKYMPYYGAVGTKVSINIPKNIPNGYYTLRAVFRQNGYEDFILPDMVGGSIRNNVYVKIENGMVLFNQVPTSIQPPKTNVEILSHDYYDLSGRRIERPYTGIVIDHQTLSDGKKIVKKIRL